jgi:hypothetical protein
VANFYFIGVSRRAVDVAGKCVAGLEQSVGQFDRLADKCEALAGSCARALSGAPSPSRR